MDRTYECLVLELHKPNSMLGK